MAIHRHVGDLEEDGSKPFSFRAVHRHVGDLNAYALDFTF